MIPLITLLTAALLALLAWWLIRRGGWVERWGKLSRLSNRVWIEDALKYLHTCEYERRNADDQGLAQTLETSGAKAERVAARLEAQKLITRQNGLLRLTE